MLPTSPVLLSDDYVVLSNNGDAPDACCMPHSSSAQHALDSHEHASTSASFDPELALLAVTPDDSPSAVDVATSTPAFASEWVPLPQPSHATAGSDEMPFRTDVTAAEVDAAACAVNRAVPEYAHNVHVMPFPKTNIIPARDAPSQPLASQPALPTGFRLRPGHPEDMFVESFRFAVEPREWLARHYSTAELKKRPFRTLSREEIWSEVLAFCAADRDDLRRAERVHEARQRAEASGRTVVYQTHRPRCRRFCIPRLAFREQCRDRTFDLRGHWRALAAGDGSTAPIELLDTSLPPWGAEPVSASVANGVPFPSISLGDAASRPWNTAAFLRLCEEAHIQDRSMVSQIVATGTYSHSQVCIGHAVLCPNYRGLAEHIADAAGAAESEIANGTISGHYPGPPLFPCIKTPRNVAVRPSDGKKRPTGDFGYDRDAQGRPGARSLNALMPLSDESYHPSLTYTSVNSVALGVGVIASIGDDFMVGKGDWANFWRQFRRARSEWFGQIYSVSSKGLILDYSLIFGDASAPSNGSRTEFILVSLIRHKLLAKLFPTDGSSCTIEWLSPNVRRWQSKRRAAFELSGEWGAWSTSERLAQLLPIDIQGYIDDTMWASTTPLFNALFDCVRTLAAELEIMTSDHKFECGTCDGRLGSYAVAPDPIDVVVGITATGDEYGWSFAPGYLIVLGKELRLHIGGGTVGDTATRLAQVADLTSTMLATATRTQLGARLVDQAALHSLIGIFGFVLQTAPQLRGLLSHPLRSLYAKTGLAGHGARRLPSSKWFLRCVLSHNAAFALQELARHCSGGLDTGVALVHRRLRSTDHVVYVLEDAAGSATDRADKGPEFLLRGAGAWIVSAHSERIDYAYQRWPPAALQAFPNVSSTAFEGAGSNIHLALAAQWHPDASAIVEVIDNSGWCFCSRALAAKSAELTPYVDVRGEQIASLRATHPRGPEILFYVFHQRREQGEIADAFSKLELRHECGRTGLELATAMLHARLPGVPLAASPLQAAPAVLFPIRRSSASVRFVLSTTTAREAEDIGALSTREWARRVKQMRAQSRRRPAAPILRTPQSAGHGIFAIVHHISHSDFS